MHERFGLHSRISLFVSLALLAGCDGCPGGKPFTPYTLDGGSPDAPGPEPAPDAALATDAGVTFTPVLAEKAPGDGATWPLDGEVTATAPSGRVWEAGLVLDVDGDGSRDLLAWATPADARGASGGRGELWFTAGRAPSAARMTVALPAPMVAPDCSPAIQLAQVGPRTGALDAKATCADGQRQWIALVRLDGASGPELRLELSVAPAPPDQMLVATIDGTDRDGDGRDDVTVTWALAREPSIFAPLRWFDRPAGLSRDPSEPEATLRARAGQLVADGRKKSGAPKVAAQARDLRLLRALLCEEAGSPRITLPDGPPRCGDTASREELAYAEGLAAITLRETPRAVTALAELELLAPGAPGPRRKDLEKLLAKQLDPRTARSIHRTAAVPSGPSAPAPSWGPLAFEANGDLLVRTTGKVVRVDRESFAESQADVLPWPSLLAWSPPERPNEIWRVSGVSQRCADRAIVAVVEGPNALATSPERRDVPLPAPWPLTVLGAPAASCAELPHVRATPLGVADGSLLLALGGDILAVNAAGATTAAAEAQAGSTPPGSGRSPDGSTLAVPTGRGLVLWRPGTTMPARALGEVAGWGCTPTNDGARLACIRGNAAEIYAVE